MTVGMMMKRVMLVLAMMGVALAQAQIVKPRNVREGKPEESAQLNYAQSPLDQVLRTYSDITGMTLLIDPQVPAININFNSQQRLTETQQLVAIEALLNMNQITLVPFGADGVFLKVIPAATAGADVKSSKDPAIPDDSSIRSHILRLKHLDMASVQPLIQNMIHPTTGKVFPMESINGFMILDISARIKQITDLMGDLDIRDETQEELFTYNIQYAQASEIAGRLNELIADSQEALRSNATGNRRNTTNSRLNILRAGGAAQAQAATLASSEIARRGIVQGKVKIVPDDRANILLITTQSVNQEFFDRIINLLDIPVEPDMVVKMVNLEFADAVDLATTMNELIGAAVSEESSPRGGADAQGDIRNATGRTVTEILRARQNNTAGASTTARGATSSDRNSSSISDLSENTRILPDERTNSLIMMGRPQDLDLLTDVVSQLDIMLAQVLIEVVIVEVNLNDNLSYGLDWLQRSLTSYSTSQQGPNGGLTVSDPINAFGGGTSVTGSGLPFVDGSTVDRDTSLAAGGLTYYMTFFNLNLDVLATLAKGSSDASVKSSPVIITTDNTEASITVAESRPIPTTSSTTLNGQIRSTFEYRDIGNVLTVTPRVSPNNMVSMEITQSADNIGGTVAIDGNDVPIITRRELQANISVMSGETIVMGGLVGEDETDAKTKVPLLGDIPGLGVFFSSTTKSKRRLELLVFLTPRVIRSRDDAMMETLRIHNGSEAQEDNSWNRREWSSSPLMEYEGRKPKGRMDRRKIKAPLPQANQLGKPIAWEQESESQRLMLKSGDDPSPQVPEEKPGEFSPLPTETPGPAVPDFQAYPSNPNGPSPLTESPVVEPPVVATPRPVVPPPPAALLPPAPRPADPLPAVPVAETVRPPLTPPEVVLPPPVAVKPEVPTPKPGAAELDELNRPIRASTPKTAAPPVLESRPAPPAKEPTTAKRPKGLLGRLFGGSDSPDKKSKPVASPLVTPSKPKPVVAPPAAPLPAVPLPAVPVVEPVRPPPTRPEVNPLPPVVVKPVVPTPAPGAAELEDLNRPIRAGTTTSAPPVLEALPAPRAQEPTTAKRPKGLLGRLFGGSDSPDKKAGPTAPPLVKPTKPKPVVAPPPLAPLPPAPEVFTPLPTETKRRNTDGGGVPSPLE